MSTNAIVAVKDLSKTYGSQNTKQYQALKEINFEVQSGEFVGIMGASGSGKTTLLNSIATLDRPTSGSIEINGKDVTTLKNNQLSEFRAHELGFIFQDFSLLENLTAKENIALPLTLNNVAKKKIDAAIDAVAQRLSISEFLDQYPGQLSGGQKQRVAAARALVHQPQLILADEPTGALDSDSARELLDMLTQINQQHVSVLMVTHDPFSASYCGRILMIKDGVIGQELVRGEQSRSEFYQQILTDLGTYR
ncbi:ABC transporter ATP-binding protein [Paucilactobacillus sp. N302-9]